MRESTNYKLRLPEDHEYFDEQAHEVYNYEQIDAILAPTADPELAYPDPMTNGPHKLASWVGWMVKLIKSITGKANWWEVPVKSIQQLSDDTAGQTGELAAHKADYTLQVPFGVSAGSANTYTVSLNPVPTSYVTGMALAVKINIDSTGASTINVNNLGAKGIKKANGTNITNLKATGIYTLRYDGTNFILQGEGASGNATAPDLLAGKTAGTDAGDITGTLALTGDVVVSDVLSGKKFYKDSPTWQLTGTMVDNGSVMITPGTVNQYISAGKHSGSGYVLGDADLVAGNIKSGVNIFGVAGSLIDGTGRKKYATGTATTLNSTNTPITVSGITFQPKVIFGISSNNINAFFYNGYDGSTYYLCADIDANDNSAHFTKTGVVVSDGFTIKTQAGVGASITWWVFE